MSDNERPMRALIQDLRLAARALARQPGLALAAVLTLALGIGGNAAIFSVVDAALLEPPPFRDPGRRVVGRKVVLAGDPVIVAGVMPRRFTFPRGPEMPAFYGFAAEPDAWLPLALSAGERQDRATRAGVAIGRLRPGKEIAAAQAELAAICRRLEQLHPRVKGWTARLVPLTEQMVGDLRPGLLMLWGAVGCLLLIACANVANLLLVRAAGRRREIAVRTALGAGRRQLIADLLLESGLLSLAGGILGVALAGGGLRLLAAFPRLLAGAADLLGAAGGTGASAPAGIGGIGGFAGLARPAGLPRGGIRPDPPGLAFPRVPCIPATLV